MRGQDEMIDQDETFEYEEMRDQDEQLQQEGPLPEAQTVSSTGSNPESGSDSPSRESFIRADRTSRSTPQLTLIQWDWFYSKQLKEFRRLAYVYTGPGQGRESAHANENPMAVAYMVAVQAPLATVA